MSAELEQDALNLAQQAVWFDQQGKFDAAAYFYSEAAKVLKAAEQAGSTAPGIATKAYEYQQRAGMLKQMLFQPNLQQLQGSGKPQHQLDLERAQFLLLQAFDEDEENNVDDAAELYMQAAELCINARKQTEDKEIQTKLTRLAEQAIERTEAIKKVTSVSTESGKLAAAGRSSPRPGRSPVAPRKVLPQLFDKHELDSDQNSRQTPANTHQGKSVSSSYTKEEIAVLRRTSLINGREYVPFMMVDLKERFAFPLPFSDKDGKLALSPKQVSRFARWVRPEDFIRDEPKMIQKVDCFSIKQTVVSDCSFVASVAISALYEKRFKKSLITSIIYPQNRAGVPIYNPCGKYMVKLNINGVLRKVVIDDYLPMSKDGDLMCSFSVLRNELWVSLLEKAYMKVMGGYDFPGSNSNIDLHSLTGWIPERVGIRVNDKDFNKDKLFKKILKKFHNGDVLITFASNMLQVPEWRCSRMEMFLLRLHLTCCRFHNGDVLITFASNMLQVPQWRCSTMETSLSHLHLTCCRFHNGDVLIRVCIYHVAGSTMEMILSQMGQATATDMLTKMFQGQQLFMLKNPWNHLRWKGNYSERDARHWTPELQRALNYNPKSAEQFDDGVFWIDYDSVCQFYEVVYMNWNPDLFQHTYCIHSTWNAGSGPIKDAYNIGDNPQYRLEVQGAGAVWVLLTRHITDKDDFAENKEFIAIVVYKGDGRRVYYPYDPPPHIDGVRINSPHYLCKMISQPPGGSASSLYTLVVSEYEKMTTIHYTLRVYATCQFSLRKIVDNYKQKRKVEGRWTARTAGGCLNNRETYRNNPIYQVALRGSEENSMLVDLKGPKQYSVGFDVGCVSTDYTNSKNVFTKKTSGDFRSGFAVLQIDSLPAGIYNITPCTYRAGQEGPFILSVQVSCEFKLSQLQ
ncbi:PREDICTED: calpain-7-like [Priapulus caudatus]|uniref:Calpain-7-like n=1 Tax=Priapulus caudatus TaxID=37621 RepID=A0ABM1EGU4_PRICU|nr:PREDICTED: calpain-7-like [Priapulus caudatus]